MESQNRFHAAQKRRSKHSFLCSDLRFLIYFLHITAWHRLPSRTFLLCSKIRCQPIPLFTSIRFPDMIPGSQSAHTAFPWDTICASYAPFAQPPNSSILSIHFLAASLVSSSIRISSASPYLTMLYTSASVVSFIFLHTQSLDSS